MDLARIKRLTKEMGWVFFGQFAAVTGALVLVRVLTEHLSPKVYGQLALGLTFAGLINQVVFGGIIVSISRYYSIAAENQDLRDYLRASQRLLGGAATIVLILGGVLFFGLWSLGYSAWLGFAGLLMLLSLLAGYGAAFSGILNAARLRALVALHGGVEAWLKILLALGAVYWLGASEVAVVAGYALSTLIVVISLYFFLRRSLVHEEKKNRQGEFWTRQMWTYGLPFASWGIFSWAQQSSDRWALEVFGSKDEVGFYAVLFQLGYAPVVMAVGMAMSFLGPILYQRAGDATDRRRSISVRLLTWRITLACLGLTLAAFFFTWCLHERLFSLLVSTEYRSASYLMPWMVMAGGLFAAGQMLALRLMSDMRASVMTSAKIWTALLGVALNLYAGSIAGIQGVVAAVVVVSGLYLAWMLILVKDS